MNIVLNGEKHETSARTVGELVAELGFGGQPVLVERNANALFPKEFDQAKLAEGDVIELIRVVAGG